MLPYIKWKSAEYNSVEECSIKNMGNAFHIHSVINGKNFSVRYHIITNTEWETLTLAIGLTLNNQTTEQLLESDGKGNWLLDGKRAPQFKGCIDIDISLTPSTNSLPIKRLKWERGEKQKIKVLYIDLLQGKLTAVEQQYEKLTDQQYRFQNVPNDFEADITVDEDGLVKEYPNLFQRF